MLLSGRWIDFLYRDEIEKINQWISLGGIAISIIVYYVFDGNAMLCLFVSAVFLMYAIIKREGILQNRVTEFISGISMEIYLSHMLIFRLIEKIHLNTVFGNGWLQYVVTVIMVLAGTIMFAVIMQFYVKNAKVLLH